MVNKIFSATFALALLLTQAAHALPQPQASPSDAFPSPSFSVASTPEPSESAAPPSFSPSDSVVPPSFSPSMSAPFPASSISPSPSAPPTQPEPEPSLPTPSPLRATFDPTFDNPDGSMDGVACSNGDFGLESQFPTFGEVPSFPFIGGAFDIVWNSTNCGSCWNVTNPSTGVSIQMTAIDTSGVGFNLAEEAFANLTNSDTSVGVIDVTATKISTTPCGAQ